MINTLGIVHVPHGLGNARSKVGRRLGGKSLLELVVRRVTDCQRLDRVVVVSADQGNEASIRRLVPPDVAVFHGRQRDALARFAAAASQFDARSIVRICAHNPFVDPELIDRLVNTADAHPHCDYIGYRRADGRPAILSQVGLLAEWCSADALGRAEREAKRPADRELVTGYLFGHPETFTVRLVPLPPELDRDDLRLEVELEEDWEHAQVIYEALGTDEWDWRRVADLLDHQPALRKRMALLNRAAVSA